MDTPPWRTDEWNLVGDLSKIEQQWMVTRQILEDPAWFGGQDQEVSGWSCGEHAGHIVLVARNFAERIAGTAHHLKVVRDIVGEEPMTPGDAGSPR